MGWCVIRSNLQFEDTRAMTSGQMNRRSMPLILPKYSGGIGVMAGIEYGSILGTSLLPGAGTIIGAILGSMIGSRSGIVYWFSSRSSFI